VSVGGGGAVSKPPWPNKCDRRSINQEIIRAKLKHYNKVVSPISDGGKAYYLAIELKVYQGAYPYSARQRLDLRETEIPFRSFT